MTAASSDLLIVSRRPQWFPRRLCSPLAAPSLGPALPWAAPAAKIQDQPMDFSKKSVAIASPPLPPPSPPPPPAVEEQKKQEPESHSRAAVSREFVFQRNLLVILIQNIRRNPAYGRRVVKFLQAACLTGDKKNVIRGIRHVGQGNAARGNGAVTGGHFGNGGGGSNSSNSSSSNFSRSGGGSGGIGSSSSYGGGFTGVGNSGGGSLHSSRSSSTDNEDGGSLGGFDDDEGAGTAVDFDLDFEFAESATRKWIADNPDLNPLKVLDHLQLRPDLSPPPPPNGSLSEVQKPPDLAAMDRDTATFLQLAVPVPDPTQTFLDIGTDFGPISMYEDDPFNLEQLVPSTFSMEPQQQQQQQQVHQLQHNLQQQQLHHQLYNESLQKPVSMGGENMAKKYLDFSSSSQLHHQHQQQQQHHTNNITAFRNQIEELAAPIHQQQQQLHH